jgi:acetamidase/formamidase
MEEKETNELSEKLTEVVCALIRNVLTEYQQQPLVKEISEKDGVAQQTYMMLERINAKDFISTKEAAFLLSCSDGHIRNLVDKAKKGTTKYPIPFRDLDGVTSFNRIELLAWSEQPKIKLRKVS